MYQSSGINFDDHTQWPPGFLTSWFYNEIEMLAGAVLAVQASFPNAYVNSWFRDPDYNAAQNPPGKPLSSHLVGLGMDLLEPNGRADPNIYVGMGGVIDNYVGDGSSGEYEPWLQPTRLYLNWTTAYEGPHLHVQAYYGGTNESNQAFSSVYDTQPWYLDWIASYVTDVRQLTAIDYT